VTSLGCSAPSSTAAVRSGAANFAEHETVIVYEDKYGTELCGAKIARLPEHVVSGRVCGTGRAVALLAPAILECIFQLPHNMLIESHWYISCGIAQDSDFLQQLRDELDLKIPAMRINTFESTASSRCLFMKNVVHAVTDLRDGTSQVAVVACVDSLCETTALEKLFKADRLKSGTNPEGFIAGEASGVFLLELESHARSRKAAIHAFISAWGSATEPHPLNDMIASTAQGLTAAFHDAFARLPGKGEEIDIVISDLNGERARATEWTLTAGRIFPINAKRREVIHPADCVGDCGAAMGAVLLATAADLMSGDLPPTNIAISTADDGGARRILCLEKGDGCDKYVDIHGHLRKPTVIMPSVIEQHKDEAAFLWFLRKRLAKAPHRGLHDLARHDNRIQAHLDGLCLAGEAGWEICQEALQQGDAGEYFAASLPAFRSGDENRITYLLENGGSDLDLSKGIISALGWLPYSQAGPYIKRLIAEQSPNLCRIGIAASAIHRIDPGKHLENALLDEDQALKARALKAVGELGRMDLLPALVGHFTHNDETCRFFAAWSAVLLGDRSAIPLLQALAVTSSCYQQQSVETAFLVMEREDTLKWYEQLAQMSERPRLAVTCAGAMGDSVLVPWLIDQMKSPALARVAGEAFTTITGADISNNGLKGSKPEGFQNGPTDNLDDEDVGIDPDDDLPWPDSELVKDWWQQHKGLFVSETRYFLGETISNTCLQQVLYSGSQRQRAIASVELRLHNMELPLFETRSPAFRQIEILKGTN
jgi:uncharacterized protein (TIGR02270 family)